MIKDIAIVGVGAVGIIIADRLTTKMGSEYVRILGDEARIERYKADGLFLNKRKLEFNYITFEENRKLPPVDLVIIATKNLQLAEVVEGLKGTVAPGTPMFSLLNGIESEAILEKAFPQAHVLYSFAKGLNSEHVGNQVYCDAFGRSYIGEKSGGISGCVSEIRDLFLSADLGVETPDDILHHQYNKFALNVAMNTLSSICYAGYGDFGVCPELEELLDRVFAEVQKVSFAYAGVQLTDADWDWSKNSIRRLDYEGKTSMYQDMEAGRKTENNWFTGTVSRLGKQFNIPTPCCDTLYLVTQGREFVQMRRTHKEKQ